MTEHKRKEKSSSAAEIELSSMMSSMDDLVFAFDSEGRFTFYHSPHTGDLYMPPERFLGQKHTDVMPAHLTVQFSEAFEKNRKGEVAQYEYWLEIDDKVRWFSTRLSPMFREGEFTGSVAVAREITQFKQMEKMLREAHIELERQVEVRTLELVAANEQLKREMEERKEAEQALRESEETARALLNALPDGAALIDTEGIILAVNETMAHRFRRHMGELAGACIWDLLPSDMSEHRRKYVDEVIRSGTAARFEDKRGGIWYDTILHPVFDAQGEVIKVAILARDITQRKQTEEELRRYSERLRLLAQRIVSTQEQERQRMSRALHDEAGQALIALKISLELIGEDLPIDCESLRQRTNDAAILADATMEQIRLLARDLHPPALDTVGLGPTLEGFCRDFAKRTQLHIDYLGLELPMMPASVCICLYRFLQEALTNVAKHACANQVHVALDCDDETVSLSVEDDGRGFDEAAKLNVSGWSMGIGLVGMQERLKSLGGRLEIESRPGQGTRLAAYIPLQEGYHDTSTEDSRHHC